MMIGLTSIGLQCCQEISPKVFHISNLFQCFKSSEYFFQYTPILFQHLLPKFLHHSSTASQVLFPTPCQPAACGGVVPPSVPTADARDLERGSRLEAAWARWGENMGEDMGMMN